MRGIVWLRRDLRLDDHHAFYAAAKRCEEVVAAFVLDPVLLRSERVGAPIVQCFFDALRALRSDLRAMSSDLALLEGGCAEQLIALARRVGAEAVFYNVDYEPTAIRRDATATQTLRNAGLDVHAFLDHAYFGADELQRADGGAFRTFTPYKRAWLDRRALQPRLPFASRRSIAPRLAAAAEISTTLCVPSPEDWGHASSPAYPQAGETLARELLEDFFDSALASYRRDRDFPAVGGTSMLSPQLRAGTIGIRTCVEAAFAYLRENDKKAQDGAPRGFRS